MNDICVELNSTLHELPFDLSQHLVNDRLRYMKNLMFSLMTTHSATWLAM